MDRHPFLTPAQAELADAHAALDHLGNPERVLPDGRTATVADRLWRRMEGCSHCFHPEEVERRVAQAHARGLAEGRARGLREAQRYLNDEAGMERGRRRREVLNWASVQMAKRASQAEVTP